MGLPLASCDDLNLPPLSKFIEIVRRVLKKFSFFFLIISNNFPIENISHVFLYSNIKYILFIRNVLKNKIFILLLLYFD